jgi:hypothetical protein
VTAAAFMARDAAQRLDQTAGDVGENAGARLGDGRLVLRDRDSAVTTKEDAKQVFDH